jgi:hypothetical protein
MTRARPVARGDRQRSRSLELKEDGMKALLAKYGMTPEQVYETGVFCALDLCARLIILQPRRRS